MLVLHNGKIKEAQNEEDRANVSVKHCDEEKMQRKERNSKGFQAKIPLQQCWR